MISTVSQAGASHPERLGETIPLMKKGYTRKTARILPGGKAAIPFGREYVSGAFSRWLNENERVDFGFPVQILTHFKEVVQRGGS